MDPDRIVVRVLSSIGISRLSLSYDATLGDLKNELSKRIQIVDGSDFRIFTEDTNSEIVGPESQCLRDFGVIHGTCLRLEQSSSSCKKSSASFRYLEAEISDNDRAKAGEYETNPENTTSSSSKDREQDDDLSKSKEPKFKSFDTFLCENGYSLGDLPLKQSYSSVNIEKGRMIKLPLGITVKHQVYRHVDHLEIMNVKEIQDFANYWITELEMSEQRGGWLYGYYVEDSHYPLGIRAVCEGIYEPPQISSLCDIEFLMDDFLFVVDTVANRLGLERIGHIFTHLPRDNYLSPQEVVDCAKTQLQRLHNSHYTGYPVSTHVTCTMHPGEDGKPVLNAFMVSDMAMALLRDGIIPEKQHDPVLLKVREPRDKREILPQIFVSGKEVDSIDPSWFIVRVNDSAPIKPYSIFSHFDFPRENRRRCGQIGPMQVKQYFENKTSGDFGEKSNPKNYSDFHFLLYIAKVLDLDTALVVVDAILNNEPLDPVLQELLNP